MTSVCIADLSRNGPGVADGELKQIPMQNADARDQLVLWDIGRVSIHHSERLAAVMRFYLFSRHSNRG